MASLTKTDPNLLISHLTLRKAIGWLGMLLPFLLLSVNFFINETDLLNNPLLFNKTFSKSYLPDNSFKSSISHYYYTAVGELFTGILITVALFMFCYKGHPKRTGEKGLFDNALTTLAGFAALGIAIFPTSSDYPINDNLRTFVSSSLTSYIHLSMAGVFFLSLAIMSMINFRRTGIRSMFGKGQHHSVYMVCGIGMLSSMAILVIYFQFFEKRWQWLDDLHPVFCMEAIALIFFGISWLTKGKVDFGKILSLVKKH